MELHVSIELTSNQWLLAEKVIKILQVYEEATCAASGDYATLLVVIPIVNSISRSLEGADAKADHGVMQMKREMLSSLKSRYNNIESNKYYALATLLDPRFKQQVFSSPSAAALAKQMLISSFEELEVACLSTPGTQSFSPKCIRLEGDNNAGKQRSILWGFFDKFVEEQ